MKILTYNVNGLRAAINKGFLDFLTKQAADVVCLQEIKALEEQLPVADFEALGYHCFFYSAQKKGYSGVAILTKTKPDQVVFGLEHPLYDFEGRGIRADFGDFSILNVYFPSGSSGEERQKIKMEFLQYFNVYIKKLKEIRKKILIVADYNIAHTSIDIHDPVGNKKTSGFLPEEREWFSQFLESGFVDTFRYLHPEKKDIYSWWSQRSKTARDRNLGWRIDYQLLSENCKANIKQAFYLSEEKHSDHCAQFLELQF